MDHPQSPLRPERRLTLELLDHHVAKARAERAKAAADFWAGVARALRRTVARIARLIRPQAAPPPRKLAR